MDRKISEIILATRNAGKVREFRELLAPLGIRVTAASELAERIEVVEDRDTFAGNALKKAMAYHRLTGLPALADDSGLSVDCLDGRPGVHSARFAGEEASDADNNAQLLREMAGVPAEQRTARFTSAIALVLSEEQTLLVEGHCEGVILEEMRGSGGFGYDPLFLIPQLGRTYAELADAEKNAVSHRGAAMAQLYAKMPSILA